jgi:hypothetical protein
MRNSKKFQPKKTSNFKRGKKTLEIKVNGLEPKKFIVFSLRFLDRSQGQSLEKWEEEQLLAKALNRIQGLCTMTVKDATQSQVLKIYGKEIPKDSNYKHPKYLDEDIEWASLRIQGKERIIGYIESDFIFNIIFLDMEHEFYPSKKKNT